MTRELVPSEVWYRTLKWIAMLTGVGGSAVTAMSKGHVAYGFSLFLASSLIWCGVAWRQREGSLLALQACFVVIDVVGIWKWGCVS